MNIEAFNSYQPKNEQEARDLALIIDFLNRNEDALDRTNLCAHVTSSAFVCNPSLTKVLFAYHHIYDSWAWVGGHNDGDPDLLKVAIKEAIEETGNQTIRPYMDEIFTVDVIYVKNHIKHGIYVPDHLHLNATFLLIADEDAEMKHNPREHKGLKWFDLDEVFHHISEERMIPVYKKAFEAIKNIKNAL